MKCDECANFKRKETRKQTGWICRDAGCGSSVACVRLTAPAWEKVPSGCPIEGYISSDWKPFYGKVVE